MTVSKAPRLAAIAAAALCLLGLWLRAHAYLAGRSLWIDEAMLAFNLVNRSFAELLAPLDYNQGAPLGFLLVQKLIIVLVGPSDTALRFLPFCAGLALMPLVYLAVRSFSRGVAPVLALALVALAPQLVYYSTEAKQYSTDALVTVAILYAAIRCTTVRQTSSFVLLGGVCIVGLWMSHPAVFAVGAAVAAIGMEALIEGRKERLRAIALVAAAFAANAAVLYWISLRQLAADDVLTNYWRDSFAPMPPWRDLGWYFRAGRDVVHNPGGLPTSVVTIALFALGAFSVVRRQWPIVVMLLAPLLLALCASALGVYPFGGRLLLFGVPLLAMIAAEGVEWLRATLAGRNSLLGGLVASLCAVHLLWNPAVIAYRTAQAPPMGEHIKPVLSGIKSRHQPGDRIYVYYGAEPAFRFYAPRYGLDVDGVVPGSASRHDPTQYGRDIDALRGNERVWFVFAHNCGECPVDEEQWMMAYLRRTGRQLDQISAPGASGFLFDLRSPR